MFQAGALITVVWLLFAFALFATRSQEWLPLFKSISGKDPKPLTLNEIGDTLAGLFAPLAFLWFFVATWLQREELGLQRKELADTRTVLDSQMTEMKRSANESNEQTRIMNETLRASLAQETYNQYSNRLYYLCRYIGINRENLRYNVAINDRNVTLRLTTAELTNSLTDEAFSVDSFFDYMRTELDNFDVEYIHGLAYQDELFKMQQNVKNFRYVYLTLKEINNDDRYNGNASIIARRNGLNIDSILVQLKIVIESIDRETAI